jgi:hypothetical protein
MTDTWTDDHQVLAQMSKIPRWERQTYVANSKHLGYPADRISLALDRLELTELYRKVRAAARKGGVGPLFPKTAPSQTEPCSHFAPESAGAERIALLDRIFPGWEIHDFGTLGARLGLSRQRMGQLFTRNPEYIRRRQAALERLRQVYGEQKTRESFIAASGLNDQSYQCFLRVTRLPKKTTRALLDGANRRAAMVARLARAEKELLDLHETTDLSLLRLAKAVGVYPKMARFWLRRAGRKIRWKTNEKHWLALKKKALRLLDGGVAMSRVQKLTGLSIVALKRAREKRNAGKSQRHEVPPPIALPRRKEIGAYTVREWATAHGCSVGRVYNACHSKGVNTSDVFKNSNQSATTAES